MKLFCIINIFVLIISIVLAENQNEVRRRVPSFIGVRGKKNQIDFLEDKDYNENCSEEGCGVGVDTNEDNGDDLLKFIPEKRVKMGFQGVRGKKRFLPFFNALDFSSATGGRKKLRSEDFFDDLNSDAYFFLDNELAKRKFYGMRGKKYPYRLNSIDIRGKKGPSGNAFIGMRGKKKDSNFPIGAESEEFYYHNLPSSKTSLNRFIQTLSNIKSDFDDDDEFLQSSDSENFQQQQQNISNE